MPQKTFEFTRRTEATAALDLSEAGSPREALDKVGSTAVLWMNQGSPLLPCSGIVISHSNMTQAYR